jgi:non-ribosomal peptide synthetase component E (peptide arylation enzyme)
MSEPGPSRNRIDRVNVADLLLRSASRTPRHLAVVDGERRLTYRALDEWVNRTAHLGIGVATRWA